MSTYQFTGTDKYYLDPELQSIVNIALAMEKPLLLTGEAGTGKTQLAFEVARALGMKMEVLRCKSTIKGEEACYTQDTVLRLNDARFGSGETGRHVQNFYDYVIWGPIGRAFNRAQQGETVLLFIDEVTRFNPRAADILLRAIQPLASGLARRMGLTAIPPTVDEVFVAEAPLLGYRQWAPADRLLWVAAGNPGVNPLDPALVRRFLVCEARLDRNVLQALPTEVQDLVGSLWDSYEQGELPLPLDYQQLTRARGAADLFRLYHARLRALDPIAAEAVARILEGNGFTGVAA